MVKNYADWSPRPSGIRPCLFRCSIRLSNSFMAKILSKLSSFSNNLSEKLFNFGKNHTGLCVHYHWDFKKKCFNPSQFMFWRYKSTFSDQTILQKNWLIKFFRKKYFNNNPCQTLFWRKEHTFQIKQFYKKKIII